MVSSPPSGLSRLYHIFSVEIDLLDILGSRSLEGVVQFVSAPGLFKGVMKIKPEELVLKECWASAKKVCACVCVCVCVCVRT
jgi:hypothetical protein